MINHSHATRTACTKGVSRPTKPRSYLDNVLDRMSKLVKVTKLVKTHPTRDFWIWHLV